ncbi:helix-turn-helix domain-containing protein [Leuconostoc pseudomesenteroides]|uniref:helix-turn-helix domain-containing protein n=1 Tax=Leuconostoc pseudomesenteroides TaxID=33968 RepID=UPI0022862E3A|nr:helix-turn-helix transcriptional regulator [Leuconostoc pseudomesenteroides]WAM37873.1 helix-turn-helix transcriptional regulator [Leuconostoc pseudomesenteroides]
MSILLDNIKKESSKRGYSLRKLNDLSGLKPNIIYSWAKQEPSLTSLQKVADVLHVSTDYLLGRTGEINPTTKTVKKADLDDDELLLSFQGKDITPEYRDAIIAILRTMPDRDKDGNII